MHTQTPNAAVSLHHGEQMQLVTGNAGLVNLFCNMQEWSCLISSLSFNFLFTVCLDEKSMCFSM